MNSTTDARATAEECLAELFLQEITSADGITFEDFEFNAIEAGNSIMAAAMGRAIEKYDDILCSDLPAGWKVHDKVAKTLPSEVGDLRYRFRRVRDGNGVEHVPYAEALDFPHGARISPGARSFLVEAGAEVSYEGASRLLARHGSTVSKTTVMNSMRRVGELCAEEDAGLARSLLADGELPGGEVESEQVLVEADGTWVRLQGVKEGEPERVEVKALVAYSAKEAVGKKVRRVDCVHHGCVASPDSFWAQGVAAVGTRFDLGKVGRCRLATDGEGWCKRGVEFFPSRVETSGQLDVWHVDHAVMSCFAKDGMEGAWKVLGALWDGDKEQACCLLEAMAAEGLAREKQAARVVGYLRNNIDLIDPDGPSMGTMESENQHVYGARMDSVPCAWSRPGADAMARIRSRRFSRRDLPRITRANSVTPGRARRREERVASLLYPKGAGKMVESTGSGYLPPHQASVADMSAEVRYAAGVDSGMISI